MENTIVALLTDTAEAVITSLIHNKVPLTFAILTAAVMGAYIDAEKMKNALLRRPKVSIFAAVAVGAFTPLCACGTMGIIIGMLTTALPWGPIMAFLTSSPLMSPDGFILISGIISFRFALALAVSSVVIGLGAGLITHVIERRTRWLENQTRFADKAAESSSCGCGTAPARDKVRSCGCGTHVQAESAASHNGAIPGAGLTGAASCTCDSRGGQVPYENKENPCAGETNISIPVLVCCAGTGSVTLAIPNRVICFVKGIRYRAIFDHIVNVGIKQILFYFMIFVAVGYLVNRFVPAAFIMGLFGAHNIYSVPLAAFIGLPLYVSGDGAIPFINSLMNAGASGGSMLAFLITGPGTSAWVIVGIAAFMKRRAIALYIGFLLVFGIVLGYLYDILNSFVLR